MATESQSKTGTSDGQNCVELVKVYELDEDNLLQVVTDSDAIIPLSEKNNVPQFHCERTLELATKNARRSQEGAPLFKQADQFEQGTI